MPVEAQPLNTEHLFSGTYQPSTYVYRDKNQVQCKKCQAWYDKRAKWHQHDKWGMQVRKMIVS